jgi:DNA-binding MarR family transcriptional regulator
MEQNSQYQNISREQLELKLGEQLNALISASHALNVRTAAAFDSSLQPAAFLIVRWLFSYGPTSATALAESTAMDRSSVSRLVNQLKQSGYVKSETHPHDKRGILLSLTELGRNKAFNALEHKGTEFYDRISKCTDSQLINFIETLKFLISQNSD